MRYLNEIQDGEKVLGHYYCAQKQTNKSKTGKSYMSLKLRDKTGTLDAKVWEINNQIGAFEENCFVKIDALAQVFNGDIQLNVKKLRKSEEGEYDPADYVPTTGKDVEMLHGQLAEYVSSVKNEYLRQLVENILKRPEIDVELTKHSAAKAFHHSYLGGLLEHTVSVVEICDFMAGRYKNVNRDILISAAILHDICKIIELSPFPENDYTDEGQLLGHIYMGAELVSKEAAKIEGFPPKLESIMKHCLLAHHGEYEYGSPKRPKTIEAHILHAADDLDAKCNIFEDFVASNAKSGNWAGYSRMLERNVRSSDYE